MRPQVSRWDDTMQLPTSPFAHAAAALARTAAAALALAAAVDVAADMPVGAPSAVGVPESGCKSGRVRPILLREEWPVLSVQMGHMEPSQQLRWPGSRMRP